MNSKIFTIFTSLFFGVFMGAVFLPAHAEQNNTANSGKAAYRPASLQPRLQFPAPPAAGVTTVLKKSGAELVFSAPPRGTYQEEVAIYKPVVDFLSKVIGKTVVYRYSDNWLSYSKDMTTDVYDIVFDGPAFNGWRIENLGHTPLVRLPEDFVFVIITKADNANLKQVKDLAGRLICAHAPPNLGTLTLLSQFDNPAREPVIVETKGWDNAYKALMDGKCAATVLPLKNLGKYDSGSTKQTKILYQHKPMPNQAFSVGPRIAPELYNKIIQALLSEEGKQATAKLRAAYAGKDFIPATSAEYAGLGELLKSSLYYH
ncbi:MAG: PhnD/SsuA/transferrin family substrate-binding protein [Gammaproteobacteria bacterium]|nr:PhnD/SsuA/transferrin family substrate-binding protein [Gammaproteobacteria bacterium]